MESYIFHQRLQPLAAKFAKNAIISLASLGIASSVWLAVEHQLPQIAHTRPTTGDADPENPTVLTLDRRPNETYEELRSRAITAARTAARESLATNQQATNVSITVIIRDRGQIAPILSLTANSDSDPRQGLKYFDQARSLLRFDDRDVATNDAESAPRRSFANPTPASSRTTTNSNSDNTRGSGAGTFSQPGRLVPPTSEQPVNTSPSSEPGATNTNTGTANPTTNTPSGQTQPGTGLVPQSLPDTTSNSSPSTPTNQPTVFPSSSSTPASSSNTGLTPAAPVTPSGLTPSQPMTPSTSPLPGTNSTPTTTPVGTTTPTTQP